MTYNLKRSAAAMAAVFASLSIAGVAQATPIFYEGFDYSAGSLNLNVNAGLGDEWNSAVAGAGATAINVVNGSLASPTGASTGRMAQIPNPSTTGTERLTFTGQSSGSVFYSLVFQPTTVAGINNNTTGAYFAGFTSQGEGAGNLATPAATGNIGARLAIRSDPANAANFQVGLSNTVAQAASNYDATTSFAPNDIVFVIAEYRFDAGATDTGRLWINPNLSTFNPNSTTPSVTVSQADIGGAVTSFFLRTTGGLPNIVNVDEIRVGTSFTDVIPEPTAVASLGLIGAAMLARRRRA